MHFAKFFIILSAISYRSLRPDFRQVYLFIIIIFFSAVTSSIARYLLQIMEIYSGNKSDNGQSYFYLSGEQTQRRVKFDYNEKYNEGGQRPLMNEPTWTVYNGINAFR